MLFYPGGAYIYRLGERRWCIGPELYGEARLEHVGTRTQHDRTYGLVIELAAFCCKFSFLVAQEVVWAETSFAGDRLPNSLPLRFGEEM